MPDLEGGNFSISNPGIFGSMFGTPLINYPQAAVFNMNGIQQRVVAINGEAEIRPVRPPNSSTIWEQFTNESLIDDVHLPNL